MQLKKPLKSSNLLWFLEHSQLNFCLSVSILHVIYNATTDSTLSTVRHFPSWLPGGGSRSFGERAYKYSMDSITPPMQYVAEQLKVCSICVCVGMMPKFDRQVVELPLPWLRIAWIGWRSSENGV